MNRRKLLQSVLAIGAVGVALKVKVVPEDAELPCKPDAVWNDKLMHDMCEQWFIDYSKDAMHL